MKILIVGYGNIGRHMYKELEKLQPDIYDPYIREYSIKSDLRYDVAFVCVPTEPRVDGSCDISIVEAAVQETNAKIIVIKSAIPVGTADMLISKYKKKIVVSPEYYGTTQHSCDSPNFLVLGGSKETCAYVAQVYYRVKNGSFRIVFTTTKTAELAKYMENCFLALKVTFCNEFADVARDYDVAYEELREIFVHDERMGESHTFVLDDQLYYDSHCLNKDIPAFISFAKEKAPLMKSVYEINLKRKECNYVLRRK